MAPVRRFQVLMTAAEAFPELERQMLTARSEVVMSFRVFDPWTRLVSPEAQTIGTNWIDLMAHTVSRGVRVSVMISDFDPVLRPELHRKTWSSVRALTAAGELSGWPELMRVRAVMHPARVGVLPRLLFWPHTVGEIRKTLARINAKPDSNPDRFLSEVPFLRRQIRKVHRKLEVRFWPVPPLVPVTHHQKLAVFDRTTLYIGGLDLDDRRYDTPDHDQPAEETWHDVQLLLEGPEVADALTHLETFQEVTEGKIEPLPTPHLLRTMSRKRRFPLIRLSPRPCAGEIAEAHRLAVKRSEHLIYFETQYFRDRRMARQLARAARKNPALGMILILPAAPDDVAFERSTSGDARYGEFLQADCVDILMRAFGDRLFIGAPAQPRPSGRNDRSQTYGAPLIYLHAKVSIFDESEAIVSSANLNGRSLRWDTEAGVRLTDPAEVGLLRRRCFDHWLGADADPACYDSAKAVQAWRARARLNVRLLPEARKGFILPYSAKPARRFGRNFPGIPEEMV